MPDAAIVQFDPNRRRRHSAPPRPTLSTVQETSPRTSARPGLSFATAMDSWELALQARGRSPRTVESYRDTVAIFTSWLADNELPDDVEAVHAADIRAFIVGETGRAYNKRLGKPKTTKPANAAKHYRNLRALFNWLVDEGERTTPSPVRKQDKPNVPKEERPPFTDDEVRALLATCKARTFENVRDEAIMRLLVDSGPRRTGVANIRYRPEHDEHDVDLKRLRIRITLKGGDDAWIPIGRNTAKALDRYIRARGRHPKAEEPWLWLSERGHFTGSGIYQMLKRRGGQAGVANVHPHRFRRTSATHFLQAGGTETDAMNIYQWADPTMVRLYTEETAKERAREVHARLSPGDRF